MNDLSLRVYLSMSHSNIYKDVFEKINNIMIYLNDEIWQNICVVFLYCGCTFFLCGFYLELVSQ